MFLSSSLNLVQRSFISSLHIFKNVTRVFSKSRTIWQKDEEVEDINLALDDKSYVDAFSEIPIQSVTRHKVLAILPDFKNISEHKKITTAELKLSELCALSESIPGWQVEDKTIISLKRPDNKLIFSKGKLKEVTDYVKNSSSKITAIVIGINTLNSLQLSQFQKLWNLPVYDRYTLVLEIFKSRATTGEAKLQVSLAEIHYLRMHLHGMHSNSLDYQKEGLKYVGGLAERTYETRNVLLRNREAKIKKQLDRISNNRTLARENRKILEIPVVAIVGYTNAGKTSLIKSLTGDSSIRPMNKLFATLDVTSFQGYLPNYTKVLYLDTVGFISDIPDSLMKAFSATLEDVAQADLLVHVSDASHPDRKAQDIIVDKTLAKMPSLPKSLLDNMICVYNKIDLVNENDRWDLVGGDDPKKLAISVKENWGRQDLLLQIQESLMEITGRVVKKLRIPAGGPILTWLYKEAAVEEVIPDENDAEMYLVKVVMTPPTLAKFNLTFRPKRK